ncbi:hypothetical protein [Sulfurospirillum sp. hDNRA2]|uniref:hypothetical protein n=1 Tax=Sulfurospirillum sp. hDNRA2 TaxID=3237298 RepID=UPI0020B8F10E|nr:hypothetical protein [Sulfurospirillum sp. DNRA8]MCP3652920.1 hypothetical protein [Sulfurospirillum sp. DNRA8]MCR1811772.1 hypothetical protein [Sulfurospirillum sp. DNRA8]
MSKIEAKNKLVMLITELMRLTIKNEIQWESKTPPRYLIEGTDDIVPIYFSVKYKDKTIALFIRRTRQYNGEFDILHWTEEVKIAIVESDTILWENTQYSSSVHDLYKRVQEQVSGLNSLLDSLL